MGTLWGIFGLVIVVLDILGIIDCIKKPFEPSKKILWILLIIFISPVGIILYYLLGRKQ